MQIGMYVVCVDASPGTQGPTDPGDNVPLQKGSVYRISDATDEYSEPAVQLFEYKHVFTEDGDDFEWWFKASRFRPLNGTRLDVFRSLLVTPKEPVAA